VNRDDAWSRAMSGGMTFRSASTSRLDREWGLDAASTHLRRRRTDLIALDEMAMQGLHNAANAMAAHALLTRSAPEGAAREGVARVQGTAACVELVAQAKGVRFYDDSKGTTSAPRSRPLAGFRDPVVLIAGGEGKGQDFAPLAPR